MKTFAFFCCAILIAALCCVLALPAANSDTNPDDGSVSVSESDSTSSSSGSSEENALVFPNYPVVPGWPADYNDELSDSSTDDGDSEHPEGRTFFLLFRLYSLLQRLNLTSAA
ncbi:uncharacterized protein [Eurosta solidaginis]|uniref:uncharacterized protein n=1 Tax=Eurosta solidaginis TaxID=178769 RepID=UPI00353145B6